uniref:Uncharacterized protein n=1 Tax=Cannabis sativa TaxID=3483 RepID=A0A803RBM2_CANSA
MLLFFFTRPSIIPSFPEISFTKHHFSHDTYRILLCRNSNINHSSTFSGRVVINKANKIISFFISLMKKPSKCRAVQNIRHEYSPHLLPLFTPRRKYNGFVIMGD